MEVAGSLSARGDSRKLPAAYIQRSHEDYETNDDGKITVFRVNVGNA